MKYKAVIFDLDGTLVDTLRDLAESVNQALEKLSLPTHPVDSFRLRVGNGMRWMVSRSLDSEHQHLLDKALALQTAYYEKHICDHSKPYGGIEDMLSTLQAKGLKLTVLSNKPDLNTQQLMNHCFSAVFFDTVLGNRPDWPLKPDPTVAIMIARQLNLPPAEIAFLGDSAMDMQTAVAAEMYPIGATWGFRDRHELLENGAQALINHPSEILPLLNVQ